MSAERILLSGGEPGGELEIGEDSVVRRLRPVPWNDVEPRLQAIGGLHERLGLVPWSRVESPGDGVILRHPRVRVISYPHEWCGEMLHDAALLHCDLLAAVSTHGLALKDAHPWNVLFDGARPKFVDVSSIVRPEDLAGLDYLRAAGPHAQDRAYEVLRVMFLPYFLTPLAFHHAGAGGAARSVLWRYALNGAHRDPRLGDYRGPPSDWRRLLRGWAAAWRAAADFKRARGAGSVQQLASTLGKLVGTLFPPLPQSDYTDYYALKKEDADLRDSRTWNAKQRNAIAALDVPEVGSVLDVACNTGWYARAAALRGKRVTAVDVDGACISMLYREVRERSEDVVPLVADVTRLSPERHRQGGGLLMIDAQRRLRSDAVLALGILHHLVLGSGLPLAQALQRISALASRRLVVEFVGREDEKVRAEPAFFPAHARDPGAFADFTLDKARTALARLGWRSEALPSHPSTRTLLVCSRA